MFCLRIAKTGTVQHTVHTHIATHNSPLKTCRKDIVIAEVTAKQLSDCSAIDYSKLAPIELPIGSVSSMFFMDGNQRNNIRTIVEAFCGETKWYVSIPSLQHYTV